MNTRKDYVWMIEYNYSDRGWFPTDLYYFKTRASARDYLNTQLYPSERKQRNYRIVKYSRNKEV